MSALRRIQRYSLMAIAILSFPACCSASEPSLPVTDKPSALGGSQKIIVTGYDWFAIVDKTILTMDKEIVNADASAFRVTEERNNGDEIKLSERPVINAYVCDEDGNRMDGASRNIALELYVESGRIAGTGSIMRRDGGYFRRADPYNLIITLADGKTLKTAAGDEMTTLNVEKKPVQVISPLLDKYKQSEYAFGDTRFGYSYYEPAADNHKNPLIIWLHGAGEGGATGAEIPLYGTSKLGVLVDDEMQQRFGGAYVLIPQSPTMWMDAGGHQLTRDGSTIYNKSLMEMIKYYVDANPDIDRDRIYLGGCSNGGFMTMVLILENPDYFAAAFPVCEALFDRWISNADIEILKSVPIWMVHAENDPYCPSPNASEPTYKRLIDAGAGDVHLTLFPDMHDLTGKYKGEDGEPLKYNNHFSWIHTLNNDCVDAETGERIFDWLARHKRNSKN